MVCDFSYCSIARVSVNKFWPSAALVLALLGCGSPPLPTVAEIKTLEQQRADKLHEATVTVAKTMMLGPSVVGSARAVVEGVIRDSAIKRRPEIIDIAQLTCTLSNKDGHVVCSYLVTQRDTAGDTSQATAGSNPSPTKTEARTEVALTNRSGKWHLDDDGSERSNVMVAAAKEANRQVDAERLTASQDSWQPFTNTDKMDGSSTQGFVASALEGGRAALIVRCNGKLQKLEAFVGTGRMVDYHHDSTAGRLKYDEAAAENRHWDVSTDHEAMFSREPVKFVQRLALAKQVMVEVPRFQAAADVYTFNVLGLQERLKSLPSWCIKALEQTPKVPSKPES